MKHPHPQTPCTKAGHDILEHVAVSTPCGACGEHYDVPLRHVLLSQELLHATCPVQHERDCPPLIYGPLADAAVVEAFNTAWNNLVRQVQSRGGEITLLGNYTGAAERCEHG